MLINGGSGGVHMLQGVSRSRRVVYSSFCEHCNEGSLCVIRFVVRAVCYWLCGIRFVIFAILFSICGSRYVILDVYFSMCDVRCVIFGM